MVNEENLGFQKPMEDYIDLLERVNFRTLPLFLEMMEADVSFSDSVHNLRGRDMVGLLWLRRFDLVSEGKFQVNDFTWGRKVGCAYLRWRYFYYENKGFSIRKKREKGHSEGVTETVFSPEGKISSHSEFWQAMPAFSRKAYRISLSHNLKIFFWVLICAIAPIGIA